MTYITAVRRQSGLHTAVRRQNGLAPQGRPDASHSVDRFAARNSMTHQSFPRPELLCPDTRVVFCRVTCGKSTHLLRSDPGRIWSLFLR